MTSPRSAGNALDTSRGKIGFRLDESFHVLFAHHRTSNFGRSGGPIEKRGTLARLIRNYSINSPSYFFIDINHQVPEQVVYSIYLRTVWVLCAIGLDRSSERFAIFAI